MIRELVAKLTGGTPVRLYGPTVGTPLYGGPYTDEEARKPGFTRSIAYTLPDGRLVARADWRYRVGGCILRPDGTIDPNSRSSYLKTWDHG